MFNLRLTLALCFFGSAVCSRGSPLPAEVGEICKLVPANTKLLVPDSCSDWVECGFNGEIIDDGSCLDGWYFDRNANKCDKSANVDCPYTSKAVKAPCASVKSGTYLQHPELCNGFIYCTDGVEHYSACPQGLNFEPVSQSCVYPDVYTCPSPDVEDGELHSICMSVGDYIRMADPNSCTVFRQCSKGVLKTTNCIAGTYFSRATGECGSIDETDCVLPETTTEEPLNLVCGTDEDPIVGFISDETTCSGYYYCEAMEDGRADRTPEFGKCNDGKFFDINFYSCKDRTNVRCEYDRCEGMGNKFANIQGNCSKYTYCHDGVSTTEGSCPENYYFDEKAQSCTKKFISYMACVE